MQIWRLTSGLWCPFCPAEEDKGIDGLLNLSSLLTDISHHPGDSPVSTNCLQNRAPREGKPPCPHSHWALDRCSARPPSFPTFPCTPDPFPGSCYRTLALRLVLTLLSLHLAVPWPTVMSHLPQGKRQLPSPSVKGSSLVRKLSREGSPAKRPRHHVPARGACATSQAHRRSRLFSAVPRLSATGLLLFSIGMYLRSFPTEAEVSSFLTAAEKSTYRARAVSTLIEKTPPNVQGAECVHENVNRASPWFTCARHVGGPWRGFLVGGTSSRQRRGWVPVGRAPGVADRPERGSQKDLEPRPKHSGSSHSWINLHF